MKKKGGHSIQYHSYFQCFPYTFYVEIYIKNIDSPTSDGEYLWRLDKTSRRITGKKEKKTEHECFSQWVSFRIASPEFFAKIVTYIKNYLYGRLLPTPAEYDSLLDHIRSKNTSAVETRHSRAKSSAYEHEQNVQPTHDPLLHLATSQVGPGVGHPAPADTEYVAKLLRPCPRTGHCVDSPTIGHGAVVPKGATRGSSQFCWSHTVSTLLFPCVRQKPPAPVLAARIRLRIASYVAGSVVLTTQSSD